MDFASLRAICRACGWQIGAARQGAYREKGSEPSALARAPESTKAPRVPLPPLPASISILEASGGQERLVVEIRESRMWRFYLATVLVSAQMVIQIASERMSPWFAVLFWLVLVWIIGATMGNTRTLTVERRIAEVEPSPSYDSPRNPY